MGDREEFLALWHQHVTRPGSEKLLDWLDHKTDFFTAPASTRFHGACEGGLCMHSLNVYHCLVDYLQRERVQLLASLGYPADWLEEKPACTQCGDTGYVQGGVCPCLRAYYAREQLAELSRLLPLGEDSFETFSFDWYDSTVQPAFGVSPRENMERNFDVCRDYAYQFDRGGGNLLLSGGTGLGKTFLSACIARVVSENGFSVVYDTAASVFSRFEDAKFRRDDGGSEDADRCMKCDLLILDDLGTEMTTAFVQSALYQIVNGRLMEKRATIISTNLAPEEIGSRYGRSVLSRLEGDYEILPFFGEDIRRLKRERQ